MLKTQIPIDLQMQKSEFTFSLESTSVLMLELFPNEPTNLILLRFQLQCSGFAVFPVNHIMNCTFVNTVAETIGATRNHLNTPLKNKPSFIFFSNAGRQGKGNNYFFLLGFNSGDHN